MSRFGLASLRCLRANPACDTGLLLPYDWIGWSPQPVAHSLSVEYSGRKPASNTRFGHGRCVHRALGRYHSAPLPLSQPLRAVLYQHTADAVGTAQALTPTRSRAVSQRIARRQLVLEEQLRGAPAPYLRCVACLSRTSSHRSLAAKLDGELGGWLQAASVTQPPPVKAIISPCVSVVDGEVSGHRVSGFASLAAHVGAGTLVIPTPDPMRRGLIVTSLTSRMCTPRCHHSILTA